MPAASPARSSDARLVTVVCAAQVMVQIGAFFWPALLPGMMRLWQLNNSEAGWITASFYGAYMLAVPLLVTLTDRLPARHVYLLGVSLIVIGHALFASIVDGFWSALIARSLTGIGWAGTYMTGLKLLADRISGTLMSRAVAGHAASIGISGALSFLAADALAGAFGWQSAFTAASLSALGAWMLVVISVPLGAPPPPKADGPALFDFRPVFGNRSAMAYAIGYCIHTLEMSALRGWGVAFLAYVAASNGVQAGMLSPTLVLTTFGLIGTFASVLGNEASIRFGRVRLVSAAMVASIWFAALLAAVGLNHYWLSVALVLVYGVFIWLDSASLTAGTAGSAEPSRRGATLAVHSTLGYAGGFVGPLIVGWVLDAAGGMSALGWGLAFASLAALVSASLIIFLLLKPASLAGEK